MNTHRIPVSCRFPWVTLVVSLVALSLQCGGEPWLRTMEWRSDAFSTGEPWRIVTGHLAHWSWEHLGWDAMMFAVLGATLETRGRTRYLVTLVIACVLSDWILQGLGRFEFYRGLSSWGMALFGLAMAEVVRCGMRSKKPGLLAVGIIGWVLMSAKVVFELLFQRALFVSSGASGFVVAVETHLAGVLSPLVVVWGEWSWRALKSLNRAVVAEA